MVERILSLQVSRESWNQVTVLLVGAGVPDSSVVAGA